MQWAEAIDNLKFDTPGSDKSFGMKIRPDGDIDINEKFWEEDFDIPTCPKCSGVLKPDVRLSTKGASTIPSASIKTFVRDFFILITFIS